jgi:uncharacterized protein (UPF0210 family)
MTGTVSDISTTSSGDHRRICQKIEQLDQDVILLRKDVDSLQDQFNDDRQRDTDAHTKLLHSIGEVNSKIEAINEVLSVHTGQEEIKFDKILTQLDEISKKTGPLVTVYEDISGWVSINKAVVDSVKWLLPLFVGIGMSYVFFTTK